MPCSAPLEIYVGTLADPVAYTAIDSITYMLQGGGHTFGFTTAQPIARWELLDRAAVRVYLHSQLIYQGTLLQMQWQIGRDETASCRYRCNGYAEHLRRHPVTLRMTGKVLGIIETILTLGNSTDFISLVDQQYISTDKRLYDLTVDFLTQYPDQAISDVCQLLGVGYYIHPHTNVLVLYEPAYLVTIDDHVLDLVNNACSDDRIFDTELRLEPNRYSRVVVCDSQETLTLLSRGIDSQEALQTQLSYPVPANAPDRSFPFRMDGVDEKRTVTAAFIRAIDASVDEWVRTAGTGSAGYSGDGGDALLADIEVVVANGVAAVMMPDYYIYLVQSGNLGNQAIRRIDAATNIITSISTDTGSAFSGIPGPLATTNIGHARHIVQHGSDQIIIFSSGTSFFQRALLRIDILAGTSSFIQPPYTLTGGWDGSTGHINSVYLGDVYAIASDSTNIYLVVTANASGDMAILRVDSSDMVTVAVGMGTLPLADGVPASNVQLLADRERIIDIRYHAGKIYILIRHERSSTEAPSWLVDEFDGIGYCITIWAYDIATGLMQHIAWDADTSRQPLAIPQVGAAIAGQQGMGGYGANLYPIGSTLLISGNGSEFWDDVSPTVLDLSGNYQYKLAGMPAEHQSYTYTLPDVISLQREAYLRYQSGTPIGIRDDWLYIASSYYVTRLISSLTRRPTAYLRQFSTTQTIGFGVRPRRGYVLSTPNTSGTVQESFDLSMLAVATLYIRYSMFVPTGSSTTIDVSIDGVSVYTDTQTTTSYDSPIISLPLTVGATRTIKCEVTIMLGDSSSYEFALAHPLVIGDTP